MDNRLNELTKKIRRSLSLEQAASLLSGEDMWSTVAFPDMGIEKVIMADGPNGVRMEIPNKKEIGDQETRKSTCFPLAVAQSCSWNPELIKTLAKAIAEEAGTYGIDVVLGPGINIKRSPLCGRNFEYYSEDPYLTGKLAIGFIQGTNDEQIGAVLKHFLANNQETRRMTIDEIIDERTLREIYLRPFEMVVKATQPMAVMASYNSVNGCFMSENKFFIEDVLRNEWHYDGLVISDWNAVNNRVKGVKAGTDLEMPGSGGYNNQKVIYAVRKGLLKRSDFNRCVERNIAFALKAAEYRRRRASTKAFDQKEHHRIACKVAEESIVLLKNEANLLPLKIDPSVTIAVIGKMAFDPRFQGEGSSRINPFQIDTPYDALKKAFGEQTKMTLSQGYSDSDPQKNKQLLQEAQRAATDNEVVILFVGLPSENESEGYDRKTLELPENQKKLIRAVTKVNQQTVLIFCNGGVVTMNDTSNAGAILETWLSGEGMGTAVASILTGKINPSGKLTETIPKRLEDTPSFINFPGFGDHVIYGEGIFVGYRYYDYVKKNVAFPFGYGLSYSEFRYDEIEVQKKGKNQFVVSCKVTNISERDGKEIIELYIGKEKGQVVRPLRELKRFEKKSFRAGETNKISFTLNPRDFSYYNVDEKKWCIEEGKHWIWIGPSSRNLPLKASVRLSENRKNEITYFSYMNDLTALPKGKQLIDALVAQYETLTGTHIDFNNGFTKTVAYTTPLYKMVAASKGMLTNKMLDKVILYLNDDTQTGPFDFTTLFENTISKKDIIWMVLSQFLPWNNKEESDQLSIDSKIGKIMACPQAYQVLTKYCDSSFLQGDLIDTVSKMGLSLRKIQSLLPSGIFTMELLNQIDEALQKINNEGEKNNEITDD